MPKDTLSTTIYLALEPVYTKFGALSGVKVVGKTTRRPRKGHYVKLKLSVPASAIQGFEAEVKIPKADVACKVIPLKPEE